MFTGSQSEEARLTRFLREADILSKVNHPNVVRIYRAGFSSDGKTPYILLEYVDGKPLTGYTKSGIIILFLFWLKTVYIKRSLILWQTKEE